MRPRVFPAENGELQLRDHDAMRPRVDANRGLSRRAGFNEAAGIPRGKLTARNPLQLKTFTPGSREVRRSPRTSGR